jgi:hypothetical protein
MNQKNNYIGFNIRKRPCYIWLLRTVWVLWLLVWAELSVGSWQELEYRAFYISLVVFLISIAIGFLILVRGYLRPIKVKRKPPAEETM